MYDSVNASNIPAGASMAAWYDYWPASHPIDGATNVHVTKGDHGNVGDVADVGDAGTFTPAQAAQWVKARRASGYPLPGPCEYVNRDEWPACIAALAAIGEPECLWWIADPGGNDVHIGDRNGLVVAVQSAYSPARDSSLVADYWPGVDPPPAPPPSPIEGDDMIGGLFWRGPHPTLADRFDNLWVDPRDESAWHSWDGGDPAAPQGVEHTDLAPSKGTAIVGTWTPDGSVLRVLMLGTDDLYVNDLELHGGPQGWRKILAPS